MAQIPHPCIQWMPVCIYLCRTSLAGPPAFRKYPLDAYRNREANMTDLATYSRSGSVATIVMDDGKANVMSLAMLNALHAAFDQAENDKTVVILKARGKHFSGGFDLNVFAKGSAEDQYLMLKAGAELALRILS